MPQSSDKTVLQQVQSGALMRGLGLAATGMRMSARLSSYSLESLFTFGDQRRERRRRMFAEQARMLVDELGRLKGSVMKIGQLLALYGDYFLLPPEVVEVLRTLQDDSPPLAWAALEPVLRAELGAERLAELEVDPEPLAAASLGQVHRARRRIDARELCIKIQYPGVAEAVDSDLDTVGMLLMFSRLLPTGFKLQELLAEVRGMLHREVDYRRELEAVQRFRELLASDDRYRAGRSGAGFIPAGVLRMGFGPDRSSLRQLSGSI